MSARFQKIRQLPAIEAALMGFTEEEIQKLDDALYEFDKGYNDMIKKLGQLGATQQVYRIVNGSIKRAMGKGRGDVDIWDLAELIVWAWGYQGTTESLEDLFDPGQVAYDSFMTAQRLYADWEEEDDEYDY